MNGDLTPSDTTFMWTLTVSNVGPRVKFDHIFLAFISKKKKNHHLLLSSLSPTSLLPRLFSLACNSLTRTAHGARQGGAELELAHSPAPATTRQCWSSILLVRRRWWGSPRRGRSQAHSAAAARGSTVAELELAHRRLWWRWGSPRRGGRICSLVPPGPRRWQSSIQLPCCHSPLDFYLAHLPSAPPLDLCFARPLLSVLLDFDSARPPLLSSLELNSCPRRSLSRPHAAFLRAMEVDEADGDELDGIIPHLQQIFMNKDDPVPDVS